MKEFLMQDNWRGIKEVLQELQQKFGETKVPDFKNEEEKENDRGKS